MTQPAPVSDYYVMTAVVSRTTVRITNEPELPPDADLWIDGQPLSADIGQPLLYEVEEGDEGEMGAFIDTAAPLMSKDLVACLRDNGVDNLDVYEAVIREVATGHEHSGYWAVNVLGVVDAADPARTAEISLEGLGTWIDRIVVDESAARQLLLFRMRQSPSRLVLHRKVKQAIENRRLPLLMFTPVNEMSG